MKQFWEQIHESRNLTWLTDSDPVKVLQMHNFVPLAGMRILDFGVGIGGMARYLKSIGCWICSVDISHLALLRVSGILDLILDWESDYPETDYGIAHLVFQHMCDEDVVKVVKRMKIKQYLSCQFISGRRQSAPLCYLRTPAQMLTLIGGQQLWLGSEFWNKGYQNHVMHIGV